MFKILGKRQGKGYIKQKQCRFQQSIDHHCYHGYNSKKKKKIFHKKELFQKYSSIFPGPVKFLNFPACFSRTKANTRTKTKTFKDFPGLLVTLFKGVVVVLFFKYFQLVSTLCANLFSNQLVFFFCFFFYFQLETKI